MRRWHSMSSSGTNLELTGHLIPLSPLPSQSLSQDYLPLYTSLGFVRHITRWHSMSSGGTNLEQTGHLIPA